VGEYFLLDGLLTNQTQMLLSVEVQSAELNTTESQHTLCHRQI